MQRVTRPASTVPGWRLSALDRHRTPITVIGWCLDVCHNKNANASRRHCFRRWTMSLELSAVCHYVTETSHLHSLRDFWRHFGLCRAVAHSDCCFSAQCTNILTYLHKWHHHHHATSPADNPIREAYYSEEQSMKKRIILAYSNFDSL